MDYGKLEDNYNNNGQAILEKPGSALSYLAYKTPKTNTCAIKMSECLNQAGYEIPSAKNAPKNVRIQDGSAADKGNFVLDAKSMGNFLRSKEKPTYSFTSLKTDKEINAAIDIIHKSDDLKGIMVLTAGNAKAYGASGHVDLIYEDFMWDLSINSYGGKDLADYLKSNTKADFKLEIWVLEQD